MCKAAPTNGVLPPAVDWRKGMHGPLDFDHTQMLTVNYIFNLPEFATNFQRLNNLVGRSALNGWQLSGITAISGGAPINPTAANGSSALYSISTGTGTIGGAQLNREVTGSGSVRIAGRVQRIRRMGKAGLDVPPRYVFTCDPYSGNRSSLEFFNPACFASLPRAAWVWIPEYINRGAQIHIEHSVPRRAVDPD